MQLIVIFFLACIASSELFSLSPKTGTVSSPEVVVFSMTQNDQLELQLSQITSAGYSWIIHKQSPQLLINKEVSEQTNSMLGQRHTTGAPSKIKFVLSCDHNCAGDANATFLYIRPWLYNKFVEGGLEAYKQADISEPGELDVIVKFS